MKVLTSIVVATLLSSSLFGGDLTQQAKLSSDMRTMLASLSSIQSAGFYKNATALKQSANKLIKSLDSIITTDARLYLPDAKKGAGKFAKKRAKMIKMYVEELVVSIEEDDMFEAAENYSQVLRQCTSCHTRIRQKEWK